MPARPSGGACERCRSRHLKCDEGRPGCLRCSTSGTECPGYVKETKFLDEGVGLRRKFNHADDYASKNMKKAKVHGKTSVEIGPEVDLSTSLTLQPPQDGEQVFKEDDVIAASPIITSDPYAEMDPGKESDAHESSQISISSIDLSTNLTSHGSGSMRVRAVNGNYSSLYNSMDSVFQASASQASGLGLTSGPALQESEEENEFEVIFLIRHFAEVIGTWLDLFDLGKYFASHVPVRARQSPLLRYSAAAIAAKQLGRVNGNKAVIGLCDRQASTEIYPDIEQTNWFYIAAKYYDKALSFLREALADIGSTNDDLSLSITVNESSSQMDRLIMQEQRHSAQADDLLASTSILSVYEFMDASSIDWSRHLSGVKSLLDEVKVSVMPLCVKPSRAQVATFWNFARSDYIAAFINHTSTRLDTEDISLWRSAGLLIDDQGVVIPGKAGFSTYIRGEHNIREDMIANALVFILSKLMNLLAAGSDDTRNDLSRWKALQHEFEVWFETLPDSFTASWRLEIDEKSDDPARSHFAEAFYSIPLCSVTMQQYHFGQILMLLHTPPATSTSVRNQLRSYREIPEKIAHHSREICAIALGRPPGYARTHMHQPLFVAGQCLEDRTERKVILDLLRGIETDLGWATGYRAKELMNDWGWEADIPTD